MVFSVGLVLLVSLSMYRLTGSFTGAAPYVVVFLYWYTFVNPIRLIILASFSMAIVLACANLVSFVTRVLSDVINDEQSNNDQSSQHNDKDSERSYARSNLSLVS